MASNNQGRRPRSSVRLPLWALILLVIAGAIVVILSATWLFRTVRELASSGATDPGDGFVASESAASDNVASPAGATAGESAPEPLPDLTEDEIRPWSGEERLTFLFLGIDQRCDEEGPTHTDSIMLASLDPLTMSLTILSLPRDLWLEIPGFGMDRINQAYYLGEAYEYPGGGQALARETIEGLLGIPVDYYITASFQGFIDAVDQIGGIVVNVPEAIDDPSYPDNCYGYDPFNIQAGQQRLDGATALKYARTRATFGGDVDRAGRQQQVILAVRDQVLQLNMLPQLIGSAPQLWRTFQDTVHTNLALEDAVQLALLVQDIPEDNIRTAVLDYDYVYNETTPDGRQVLVPRRDEIRALRDEIFAPPAVPTPEFAALPELMAEEDTRVALYNGTAVFGLAGETQTYLQGLGVNVTEIGNADAATYQTTQIIDYGPEPHTNTVLYLIQQMGIPPLNVSNSAQEPDGDFDVLVIIGADWSIPGSPGSE